MTADFESVPLRIGNAERDAAVKALDEHLAAGRLDLDEYGSRYALALTARTMEDLRPLFADLPAPGPFVRASQDRAADGMRESRRPVSAFHGAALWLLLPAAFLLLPIAVLAVLESRGLFLPLFFFLFLGRVFRGGPARRFGGYGRPGCRV